MPRHPTANEWRSLRRTALSGRTEETLQQLEHLQRLYPDDEQVAEELKRLKEGKPLRVLENKQQRAARSVLEAQQDIEKILERFGKPQTISCAHTHDLRAVFCELKDHIKVLKSAKQPAPQGTRALLRNFKKELSRRRKKNTRSRMIRLAIAGGVIVALACLFGVLRGRAGNLVHQLKDAVNAADWERTDGLLKAADTGINRLVHGKVAPTVAIARKWQQFVLSESTELTRQMQLYEKLEAVSSLSVEERAHFIRRIRALPTPYSTQLLSQWDELCRPEREILEQQKREYIKRFSAPCPAPDLTGKPEDDLPRLQEVAHHLARLMNDFQDAKDIFSLDDQLISQQRETFHKVQNYIHDIDQLSRATALIGTARSYGEHRRALADLTPLAYPLAMQIARVAKAFCKDEADIFAAIRGMKYKLPISGHDPYPPYVMNAIVQAGPTFSEGAPATAQQVALMEDIFTSRTLTQKLYELTAHDGRVNYSETTPELTDRNMLRFKMSALDPAYSSTNNVCEWAFPQAVRVRVVNAAALLKATGIERSLFFLRANIPDLLGRITTVHDETCPALAKAYMYDILLQLAMGHKKQQGLGLRFAPTLRRDMQSFRKLGESLKYPLSVTCWLNHDAATTRAEQAYAAWFNEHADRNYAREMSANLRRMIHDVPDYIGYVDGQGNTCFKSFQAPAADRTLYYFSGGKLKSSPAQNPLLNPDMFSPVFSY